MYLFYISIKYLSNYLSNFDIKYGNYNYEINILNFSFLKIIAIRLLFIYIKINSI